MKCLLMFSGGLDSVITAHVLKSQGLEVIALHFALPFESGLHFTFDQVRYFADHLEIALRIEEEGEEFLAMVRDPHFGYGKNVNPCIDCRIHRLQKAEKIMHEAGAAFMATGEVLGQRPMSQRRDALLAIEARSGLSGLLLRPLSAHYLPPTIPEEKGWVDRGKFPVIRGRGRGQQLAYARLHGLKHKTPGGGCVLTEKEVARRYVDLEKKQKLFDLSDFKLLAYGRHFRISPRVRAVVGRDHRENCIIQKIVRSSDYLLQMANTEGPLGLVRGECGEQELLQCASLVIRYSKERKSETAQVLVLREINETIIEAAPATDDYCNQHRI